LVIWAISTNTLCPVMEKTLNVERPEISKNKKK